MHNRRRGFYIIASVLAIMLLIGAVYAATTGVLNFGGTAKLNNVKLIIVDETITGELAGESVGVNPAKDTLSFTVRLTEGQTRYIKFKVENVGNRPAVLGTLMETTPAESGSGVEVTWPSMNGDIIEHETKSGEYTIAVHWNEAYPNVTQDVTLSATISYSQHTPAASAAS